jgi:hypothetical protein
MVYATCFVLLYYYESFIYNLAFYVMFLLAMNAGTTVPYCMKVLWCGVNMTDDIVVAIPLKIESERYSSSSSCLAQVRETMSLIVDSTMMQ